MRVLDSVFVSDLIFCAPRSKFTFASIHLAQFLRAVLSAPFDKRFSASDEKAVEKEWQKMVQKCSKKYPQNLVHFSAEKVELNSTFYCTVKG